MKKWQENKMNIAEYFETIKYVLMTLTFVALVLIFLYIIYGGEGKKTS
ncbi:MAG: hypothetical protein QXP06_03770 [Candidatus Bathyarchaeia archaeon]